jgi:RAD50-interacting protein 1
LARKLRRSVPQLLEQPALLAHTIYQALSFDAAITEGGFSLNGTSAGEPDEKWAGISDIILGQKDWFEAWVEAERKCMLFFPSFHANLSNIMKNVVADEQYNEIISSSDAWLIANDDGTAEGFSTADITPTNSARKFVALVEQVTGT